MIYKKDSILCCANCGKEAYKVIGDCPSDSSLVDMAKNLEYMNGDKVLESDRISYCGCGNYLVGEENLVWK